LCERGGIVHAVADHRHCVAAFLQVAHHRHLVLGHHTRIEVVLIGVDPHLHGNRARGAGVVAGEQHGGEPHHL
jgi:hypothetical protein